MRNLSSTRFLSIRRMIWMALSAVVLVLAGYQKAGAQAVTCPPNIDFSFGTLANWYCWTGMSTPGVTTPVFTSPVFSGPVSGRHDITSGTGVDPYGGFTVTAPGGGLFSCKLGNSSIGAEAERMQYYVRVPVGFNNYSFAYKYAVVFEDPGHSPEQQPAFMIIAYDSATGNPIPCATITYVAGAGLPGFMQSTASIVTTQPTWYLPWTNGTLNLSGQGGKTIIVEVTSYDCTATGHFGYGYFDIVSCGQFAAAITYCNLSAGYVTLSAPFGYKTYRWYRGPVATGAPISTAQSWNAPIPTTCNYFICVLTPYNSNGCPDTIRTRNICDFQVSASPDTVCNTLGKPIQLNVAATGGLGGFTYQWVSNPTLSCLKCTNPIASPVGSGVYVVSVTDSVGCFRNDTVVVQNPSFHVNLGPDQTTCLGTSIRLTPILTPPGAGYIFSWTPVTKLSNPTILNPTYTPTGLGWDTFALRVDSGVCATADTFRIRTLPNNFEVADTAVCEGTAFIPHVVGAPEFTYVWTPNPPGVLDFTGSPNGMKPTVKADTTRTFIVTAKYPRCPDMVNNINFRVEPMPLVDIGFDSIQKCFYTPLYITAHVKPTWFTHYAYQWKVDDNIDDVNSPIITFTGPKDTTLIVTVTTPLQCTGKDSVRVQVYQGRFGYVTPPDTAVCPHNTVNYSASGGVSYLWRPALYLSDSTTANVVANAATTMNYTLYVTDKNGCVDTLPVNLQVYSEALVDLPDSTTLYPGDSYQMDPQGNGLYFSWFPVLGLSNPNIANPVASPTVNTRYYVTGMTESGCVSMDSMYIMVVEETPIDMPNAFTPGVQPNPTFKVAHRGVASLKSFKVYNRWGTKIFETTDISQGWDGTFNGESQPMGVYVYTVEALDNKGKSFVKNGNVTLLR
jgi:gliding motility-associated-like protein